MHTRTIPTLRVLAAVTLALALAAPARAANITIKGSDTMVILAQRWAETFMQNNPGNSLPVRVSVEPIQP